MDPTMASAESLQEGAEGETLIPRNGSPLEKVAHVRAKFVVATSELGICQDRGCECRTCARRRGIGLPFFLVLAVYPPLTPRTYPPRTNQFRLAFGVLCMRNSDCE